MNLKDVRSVLNQLNIKPQKNLGQNFLIDKNMVKKIISISEISKDDVVLEIGPGLGALTAELVLKAKKVYSVEIDSQLSSFLSKKFAKHGNIEIINEDILKLDDLPPHDKVVSNLPFTITGPILEKVFYKPKPPIGIITIEKSISDRIFYTKEYKKFSRITVSFNSFLKPIAKHNISRKCFYPAPNIDLSLIKLIPLEEINPFLLSDENIEFFLKFVSKIMPYKNKNIANGLELFAKNSDGFDLSREEITRALNQIGIKSEMKVFNLKIDDFAKLSKILIRGD